jgi:hypothetical protein
MYNVYAHEKKAKLEKNPKALESLKKTKENFRDLLSEKYKERMNNTLLQLNKQAEGLQKPRAQTAAGSSRLRKTGSMTDQERIHQSENWNSWLDPTPNPHSSFRLRPREKSKELQPFLKFKEKSGMDRLKESLSRQKEFIDTSAGPQSVHRCLYKDFFGDEKLILEGGKEVLDYYHLKTHFKTIESLALDLHSSTRNLSKAEIKKKHNDEKLGMTEAKKVKGSVQEGLCIEDIKPMSSEVLEKFGLWEGRKVFHSRNTSARQSSPKWPESRMRRSRKSSVV